MLDKKVFSNIFAPVLLFVLGYFICFRNGFTYLHPMDQSIVFDGAWRLLCGQWFFEDFKTPVGFVPILLQAVFSKAFGVNWTAYCIHAATLNGLFAVLVYCTLRLYNSNVLVAFYFALVSSVVFYAPMATPYPDQHAFFFSFATMVAVLATSRSRGVVRYILWWCVPFLGALALLSKHIPSAFILLGAFLLFLFVVRKEPWKPLVMGLSAGTLVSVLFVLWIFPLEQIRTGAVWETVIAIPSELGQGRWVESGSFSWRWVRSVYLRPFQVLTGHNFWDSVLVLFPIVVVPVAWLIPNFRKAIDLRYDTKLLALLVFVHVSSSQFIVLTGNQRENGIPFIFLTIGLTVVWFMRSKVLTTIFSRKENWVRPITYGFCSILVLTTAWEAWEFDQEINQDRKVLDAEFIPRDVQDVVMNDYGLDGLKYNAAWYHSQLRPDSLIGFLRSFENDPKVFLWGDMNLIYGLSEIEPITPLLWLHSGLTFPDTNSTGFREFKEEFSNHIINENPSMVIFEHHTRKTATHVDWNRFPKLDVWLRESVRRTEFVGGFEVYYLKK